MSLPGIDWLSPAAEAARIERFACAGRLVQIAAVRGGKVLHTSAGFGAEFWLLPEGADPDHIAFDEDGAPEGAALICEGEAPVGDVERLRAQGATITLRIPQF